MMSRYRRNRRKQLRGGGEGPGFIEGGQKPGASTHFEHNEPPSASEAVRQQQAGATEDAEMQMAMNQTGGNREQEGGEELTVPQSGAASPEGNDAMAQSAGMLMQSRQNAPANTPAPDIKAGGFRRRRRRRTRRKRGGNEGEECDEDDEGEEASCGTGYTCEINKSGHGYACTKQAGGRRKRRTRRRKKRKRKSTKKKRRRRKRKTKRKYKIAKKYRQKGCSRKRR